MTEEADPTTQGGGPRKGRGLGRGLDALLGGRPPGGGGGQGGQAGSGTEEGEGRDVRTLPVAFIHANPDQPRRRFTEEEMAQLVDSVRERGILQPILVRPHPDRSGEFQIVAGERRWRAAQQAGLHELPVIVRRFTDSETLQIAIVENVQRRDLSPLEEAAGYRRLIDEFRMSQGRIAETIGKSRVHVANTLRLLDLPAPVRKLLDDDSITAGHARALLGAPDPEALAREVVEGGLSVRQTEARVRASRDRPQPPRTPAPRKSNDTIGLEQELSSRLGLEVTLSGEGAVGAITIHYRSLDQLDEIIQRLTAA